MYYVYGALNSKASDKAELLLHVCRKHYKFFTLGEDYTIAQLHKLVPETNVVPHIFHNTTYIGGVKELYDYLYSIKKAKFEEL
jgi:hypothetical protein